MKISFMSFNLRFGLAQDGENSWEHRREAVKQLLEAHRPDFLAVQEANIFQAGEISSMLPGYGANGVRRPAPRFWQNNVIYSAAAWTETFREHFFLSATPGIPSRFPQSKWPRQCTLGVYSRKGLSVVVADTHFDFAESVQVRSAKLLMERLSRHDCPAVLMGDFNAAPESACYGVLTGQAAEGGTPLTDVFDSCDPDFVSGTHHGFTGEANCKIGRIDWILCRGFGNIAEKRIIRDSCCGRYPSDHFPVWAALEI